MKPYGELNLTVSSPEQAFDEPLTLRSVKEYLNLDQGVTAQVDENLESFISAARSMAEDLQGLDLVGKQYDLTLDYFRPYAIELRQPLRSVDLFQYTDSDGVDHPLVEGIDYIVDLRRGLVKPPIDWTWPTTGTLWPTSAILIRFTSGYSSGSAFWLDHGAKILQGMRMLIVGWHEGRYPYGNNVNELPYAVTALLSWGSKKVAH